MGVIETAKIGISTFDGILKLQKEIDGKLQKLGSRANKAQLLLDDLYSKPLTDANRVKKITKSSLPTAYKLLDDLEKLKIIKKVRGEKRGKQYLFSSYINLFI